MVNRPTDDELERTANYCDIASNVMKETDNTFQTGQSILDEAAAMLRACKGRARVRPGQIERAVWSAMKWAAENNPGFDGVPEYTDRGNSFAETECRAAADRILAALEPASDQGEWDAAIEAAAKVADDYAALCRAQPEFKITAPVHDAAALRVSKLIRTLKKGQTND